MGKEIEKKWVGIPTDELKEFCRTADFVEIKDFNSVIEITDLFKK